MRTRTRSSQGASDDFIGPCDDVVVADESEGIDFEGEVAVIVDEVPMRTRAGDAEPHVKLLLLCNDVSLRSYVSRELYRTFYGDTVKNIMRWLGDRDESDETGEE